MTLPKQEDGSARYDSVGQRTAPLITNLLDTRTHNNQPWLGTRWP